jgi:hypothetical protein
MLLGAGGVSGCGDDGSGGGQAGFAGVAAVAGKAGASAGGKGGTSNVGGKGGTSAAGGKGATAGTPGEGGTGAISGSHSVGGGANSGAAGVDDGAGGAMAGDAGQAGATAGDAGQGGAESEAGDGGSGGDFEMGGTGATSGAGSSGTSGGGSAGMGGGGTTCEGAPGPDCACLKVTLEGDDGAALASAGSLAFGSVQAAIDFAAANPAGTTNVCVAPGSTCGVTATFSYAEGDGAGLTLRNGVSVYGNYESSSWTRCGDSTTNLAANAAGLGIVFGPEIAEETVLDGFDVSGNVAAEDAAVVADGAVGAKLANVRVVVPAGGGPSVGVAAVRGAILGLSHVNIAGGSNELSTTGVRAIGAAVTVSDSVIQVTGGTSAVAIELSDAPGSVLTTSTLSARGTIGATVSALSIAGDAEGTWINGNSLRASGPAYALSGVAIHDCDGELRIEGNTIAADNPTSGYMSGQPPTYGAQIRGTCTAHVTANSIVSIGGNDIVNTALFCNAPCSIEANPDIHVDKTGQRVGGVQGLATGILCEGCREIRNNVVNGLVNPSGAHRSTVYQSTGVTVRGATLVALNRITGGCSATAVGVEAGDGARLENNLILGRPDSSDCGEEIPTYSGSSIGVRTLSAVDIHSNRIIAGYGENESVGIATRSGGSSVILRNNQFFGYTAALRGVAFGQVPSLFGVLENNDFGGPIRTEGPQPEVFDTPEEINALPGASGNLVGACAGPSYDMDFHLIGGSRCIDAGTATNAPARDWDGELRDSQPDIGPDEYSTVHDVCYGVTCGGHGRCLPLAGEVTCQCDPDHVPSPENPLECTFNSCSVSGACDPLTFCLHTSEGRVCSACPTGYSGSGETGCIDNDECATANGGCDALTTCTNTPGSRSCGPCPPNHSGTGETGCTFSAVCSPNPCQHGAACTPGSTTFSCACPPGVTGATCNRSFSELTIGSSYFCGLSADGTLRCDRNATLRNPEVLAGSFLAAASGNAHACAIRSDGSMLCFGYNDFGQATAPAGTFRAVDVSQFRTCAIRTDGSLTCFGMDFFGGTLPPSGTFTKLAAGPNSACAIDTDQQIVCFGWNTHGQNDSPPGQFQQVSAGDDFACGLRADGTIACWGNPSFDQTVPPSGTFTQLTSGGHSSCALRSNDGSIACWGYIGASPPGAFRAVAIVKEQNSELANACAIRSDDVVVCWGPRNYQAPTGAP